MRRLEGDQGVFADPAQVLFSDQVGPRRQRPERVPIDPGPDGDDLPVGTVDLGSPDRQPRRERPVQVGHRVEPPARDHVIAHDVDLAFDPALTGGSVRGQDVNDEPVVRRERGRFRVQRDGYPGGDVAFDDGLGPVVHDRAGDPTEVGERPPVAVPERGQVHRRRVTTERVPRVRQRHVERVHVRDTDVSEQVTFLTPVDLGLRAGNDLEPAVKPGQRVLILHREQRRDPRPLHRQILLDPLVRTGEPVLGDQPLMDHRTLDRDIRTQPRLHHTDERVNQTRLGPHPRRPRRRADQPVLGQVLLHRPPVMLGFPPDRGGFLMPPPVGGRWWPRTRPVSSSQRSCDDVGCCRTRSTIRPRPVGRGRGR